MTHDTDLTSVSTENNSDDVTSVNSNAATNLSDSSLSSFASIVYSAYTEQLKIGTLNVCGLKRRLNYPEFQDLIKQFDIFCVSESKLGKYDDITLEGYTFLSQYRKQHFIRKSGGIGVFLKFDIAPYVTYIDSDSDFILWFKLSKQLLKTDQDVVIGAVYVPPSVSRFCTEDELDMFEVEICNMCIQYKYVLLTGDFNARTWIKDDFTTADDFLADYFDFDDTIRNFFNASSVLLDNNMNLRRISHDTVCNNEGNALLEICKSNNLCILNGRCGKDKNLGSFTFKHTSVIDYSITTVDTFKFIDDFEVTELDSLFSDGHSLLRSTLKFQNIKRIPQTPSQNITNKNQPKWKDTKKTEFILNLDDDKISLMQTQLQQAQINIAEMNKEKMNEFCTKISEIFKESRTKTFKGNFNYDKKSDDKRWFGPKCRLARNKYHLARRINQQNPSHTNKSNLKAASKSYKQSMNFYLNKLNKDTQDKLRSLKIRARKNFGK